MKRIRSLMAMPAPANGDRGNGPAVGTRRTINGQLAEWDGRGWLAVGGGR
jgi:hypothetical protein